MNNKTMAILAWLIGAFFYAYQYILRVVPNLILPELSEYFEIGAHQLGQISGIYYIGYALMHIPIGIMLDRFQLKYILPSMVIVSTIGMLPFVVSKIWIYPLIGRFILGCGSTAAILGLFKIISSLFDPNRFARMLSIAVTIGLMGAIYGGAPLNFLISKYGWQEVIWALIYSGIILAVAFYIFIPKFANSTTSNQAIWQDILMIITNKKIILTCLTAGLMVGPIEGFADIWGKQFFQHVHNISDKTSASLTSLIFIGMCFGAPIISSYAEKFNRYYLAIILCNIIMTSCFLIIIFIKLPVIFISAIMFIVGVTCSYQIIAITMACKFIDTKFTALTSAIANMIIMSFGYIFHSMIGFLIRITKSLAMDVQTQYMAGISIIPILTFVGLILFTRLKNKNNIIS